MTSKEEEILCFLRNVSFIEVDNENAVKTEFFNTFKNRYNGIPILKRYTCEDKVKFKECIHFLEVGSKVKTVFDWKFITINSKIYSLLRNESLKTISNVDGEIADFTYINNDYNTIETFKKLNFSKIEPFDFGKEMERLAKEGSIYKGWEYPIYETERMTCEFKNQIIEGRYDDFKIYKTTDCWGNYILGFFVAYIIFDEGKSEVWFLSKDDYD
jgi:hypothetical protein